MDFVSISITTHVYSIVALMLIMVFNFYSVMRMKNFVDLTKRLRLMTPIYHMANAFVVYTGAIVAAYSQDLSITVILMIATSIFVMVLEIKRYKKMRVIKTTQIAKQQEFVMFAKKIYNLEILAILFTYTISKIF
ncbi:MAG: hypothetical protein K8R39_05805 [Arcobacteraceae bacterium]|nr:hypothetical protein [Arcobacteraceae bacterium]